jgi:hypothetical protein
MAFPNAEHPSKQCSQMTWTDFGIYTKQIERTSEGETQEKVLCVFVIRR